MANNILIIVYKYESKPARTLEIKTNMIIEWIAWFRRLRLLQIQCADGNRPLQTMDISP